MIMAFSSINILTHLFANIEIPQEVHSLTSSTNMSCVIIKHCRVLRFLGVEVPQYERCNPFYLGRQLSKNLGYPRGGNLSFRARRKFGGIGFHKTASLHQFEMTDSQATAPNAELLEWAKKDKRRFLHAVYRVGNLDETIKFYTECFGMKLLRKRDVPEEKYTNAFLGFGPEESHFVLELTYNYGVDSYDIGTGFGFFTIATPDVYKLVEKIKAKGGTVTREPGPETGGTAVIAFVKDPTGYRFEIVQRDAAPEPLCLIMLRVGDLERSIKFYEKALGMKLLKQFDRPEQKWGMAFMGYDPETIRLGLTYNYGVTEYTKGNGYAQIAIGTDDVYKSAEVVNLVNQELGGKITRQPGPLPGLNTKIVSFLDPDGWKTVLVDNEDFLKELK